MPWGPQDLNAHLNAFDVDSVVDTLRAALRDEAAVLLDDAAFLRECIAGEHAYRCAATWINGAASAAGSSGSPCRLDALRVSGGGVEPAQPSLLELRSLRARLQKSVTDHAECAADGCWLLLLHG